MYKRLFFLPRYSSLSLPRTRSAYWRCNGAHSKWADLHLCPCWWCVCVCVLRQFFRPNFFLSSFSEFSVIFTHNGVFEYRLQGYHITGSKFIYQVVPAPYIIVFINVEYYLQHVLFFSINWHRWSSRIKYYTVGDKNKAKELSARLATNLSIIVTLIFWYCLRILGRMLDNKEANANMRTHIQNEYIGYFNLRQ